LIFKSAFDNVVREIAVMKKLNHQNICRIYEIINDPKDANIYLSKNIIFFKIIWNILIFLIVLEYLSRGQLVEWDEDLSKFYRLPDTNDISQNNNNLDQKDFTLYDDDKIRFIFRSLVIGLNYRNIK